MIFRGEVAQINKPNQIPLQLQRVFPAHTLTRLIAGKCLVLKMLLLAFTVNQREGIAHFSTGRRVAVTFSEAGKFYLSTINYTITSCCISRDIAVCLWILICKHL